MGCDIHMFVEIRKNDKWELFKGDHFSMDAWDKDYYKKEKTSAPFEWRSYGMFAFLSGVRNGSGIKPIKEPIRILPNDASDDVKVEWTEIWDGDGHSLSCLTARELVEFDYNQDIRKEGENFKSNTRKVLTEIVPIPSLKKEITERVLAETYFEYMGANSMFFTHVKELSELGNLDDVRLIFWFDN
jgi:hypothetical protein